jgi:hypothetical protein
MRHHPNPSTESKMHPQEYIELSVTTLFDEAPGYKQEVGTGILLPDELAARVPADRQEAFGYAELVRRGNTGDWDGCPDGIRGRGGLTGFPDLHHMLRWALLDRNLDRATAILQSGIRTDVECMVLPPTNASGTDFRVQQTAMQMAVHLDSRAGKLELLPVLARFGDVLQVPSHGFTLLEGAFHPEVIDYLVDHEVAAYVVDWSGDRLEYRVAPQTWTWIERRLLDRQVPAATGVMSAVRRL